MSPRWRRYISSLAYSALVALVAGLGYLTFRAASERHRGGDTPGEVGAEQGGVALVEFESFSTRREKTSDAERLNVSLRLRLTVPGSIDSYVYILARNDHVSPKLWAVWPPQGPAGALTAGGHFRGNAPATGEPVKLTSSWVRINASIDHPPGQPPFDMVMVYVVSSKGDVLLARPFSL
jgi:hypothetical protein